MFRPSRTTRTILAVLSWVAAAGVAVAVGLVAVSALGRGILDSGPPVTSQREVAAELARPAPPPANAEPGQAPDSPTSPPNEQGDAQRNHVERTPGGTFVSRCDRSSGEEQAALVSWSPAQGFQTDDVQDGPGDEVEVTFESEDLDVEASVVCRNGQPLTSVDVDD